jgi:hypothetical protein
MGGSKCKGFGTWRGCESADFHRRSTSRRLRPKNSVKTALSTVKEPYRPARSGLLRDYQGPMTDVLYVLITLVAFAGLALLVGALDR